ncbi:hypothetical protein HQ535_10400 [bacterium]|nr:hypothetical protein [bacterium]
MTTTIVVIVILVLALSGVAAAFMTRSRRSALSADTPVDGTAGRLLAPVAEFHVKGPDALVSFDVPIPAGGADEVLSNLLVREAVEVVREKRHTLPITEVQRVVALGRSGADWVEVGSVGLDTPGELPPPMAPILLPHASHAGFDAFDAMEKLGDMPTQAPGLADASVGETLAPIASELRFPAQVDAGLRAQGLDPEDAAPGDVVLGLMRLTGYTVTAGSKDGTSIATRGGQRVYVRTVDHAPSDHPELDESIVRSFVVEFVESGCDRGLLVTEKFCPFEVYERERREPRVRFITRERFQHFVDALALG